MGNTINRDSAVVAAGHPQTAEAGAQILQQGGNAVDAAVAAKLAAFAAEPVLTSPFGGGFATVAGASTEPTCFQFFANAPGLEEQASETRGSFDFRPLEVDFGATTQVFHVGRGAVAVPLMLPGLVELHTQYGQLPLAQVAAGAIELARTGSRVSPALAFILEILKPILMHSPEAAALFAPNGSLLQAGDLFRSPDLGDLLEQVAAGSHNDINEQLLRNFGAPMGKLTDADFTNRKVIVTPPLHVKCKEYDIYLPPLPTSGGLLVAFGLKLLEDCPSDVWQNETTSYRHILAAMTASQQAREEKLDHALHGDTTDLSKVAENLLAADQMAEWKSVFQRALEAPINERLQLPHELGSTTHVSVVDGTGLACSITTSNGEGCGHVVPGSGAMANNFMGEEDLHPRGFHQLPPGQPLTSMMCPTIVTRDGQPQLALGTGGSNRIRTALLQVLARHLLGGATIEESVAAPRLHYEGGPLYIEQRGVGPALSQETIHELENLGSDVVVFENANMFFGGVHVAGKNGEGAGDERRGGIIRAIT